jgi:transposase
MKRQIFKPYEPQQEMLLPPSLEELIPEGHLVRVVNQMIEAIDRRVLESQYQGGGTSAYDPQMLLKVIIYAYTQRAFSSRRIAKELRENVNYMWLSGMNRPDHRTINRFRGR